MSYDLCTILLPENRDELYLRLRSLQIGLDTGVVDPQTISESKCFPYLVRLRSDPSVSESAGQISNIFDFHFPKPQRSLGSFLKEYLADDDGKTQAVETLYPTQITQSVEHVSTPTVQGAIGQNLLPELINLIGGYHTNCDTLTRGGEQCGMGDRGDFVYSYPLSTETEQCQSECTGHLCTAWINHLLNTRPTTVELSIQGATAPNGVDIDGKYIVASTNFEIPSTFWEIEIPGANSSVTTSSSSSSSSLQSLNPGVGVVDTIKVSPSFVNAGCRILNSGKNLTLRVVMKLIPENEEAKSNLDKIGYAVLHYSMAKLYGGRVEELQVNFPDLVNASYFRGTTNWKISGNGLPGRPYQLVGNLTILSKQSVNEQLQKQILQQELRRQAAVAVATNERRKRSFQTMSTQSSLSTSSAPSLSSLLLPQFTRGAEGEDEEGPAYKTYRTRPPQLPEEGGGGGWSE